MFHAIYLIDSSVARNCFSSLSSLWQTRRYTVFCLLTLSYLKQRHGLKSSEKIKTHTNTNSTIATHCTFNSSSQIHCRTAAGKQAQINPMYHMRRLRRHEKPVIESNQMLSLLPLQSYSAVFLLLKVCTRDLVLFAQCVHMCSCEVYRGALCKWLAKRILFSRYFVMLKWFRFPRFNHFGAGM